MLLRGSPQSGMQAGLGPGSSFLRGQQLAHSCRPLSCQRQALQIVCVGRAPADPKKVRLLQEGERLRLDNLAPQPGSRRKNLRKGRGYGGHQGGTCGFGMRGQNSRSGSGTRPGFEGGQMPLYRRLPKLKGVAGGMGAGQAKFVTVNLRQLEAKFSEGEEVSLESLKAKRLLNPSGRDGKLPLKVLGDGELKVALTIKATQFSASARDKIEKAGGSIVEVPQKIVWTRKLGNERKEAAAASAAPAKGDSKASRE